MSITKAAPVVAPYLRQIGDHKWALDNISYSDYSFTVEIDVSYGEMNIKTFCASDGDRWQCETREERKARHETHLQYEDELPETIDDAFFVWDHMKGAQDRCADAVERFKAIQYIVNL